MTLGCRAFEDRDAGRWDGFVAAHPEATFFHLSAWQRILAKTFKHRPCYVLAERGGLICGVLPLVEVKTLLFGHTFVSTPFCVQGGPLSEDPETEAALIGYAAAMMDARGAESCELRSDLDETSDPSIWRRTPPLYDRFRKRLPNEEAPAFKAIPRKQRAVVRKALDAGLKARDDRSVEPFFSLYAESVHRLGTPVFPRRYVAALLEAFPANVEIMTILHDNDPICGVLSFTFREQVLPYYAGGGARAREFGGHDFMYWMLMRSAISRGLTVFDFGRSKVGSGAHKFKRNWGFVPEPLEYRVRLAPGTSMPERNPSNPKYRRLIALWQQLPGPVANALGPHVVRGLG